MSSIGTGRLVLLPASEVILCSQSSALLMTRLVRREPAGRGDLALQLTSDSSVSEPPLQPLLHRVTPLVRGPRATASQAHCSSDLQARGGEGAAPLLILVDNCRFCRLQAKPISKANR